LYFPDSTRTARNTGAAFIYQRVNQIYWQNIGTIVSPQDTAYDFFGWSVALHNGMVAIGNNCLRK
jgi:hypothetical protein